MIAADRPQEVRESYGQAEALARARRPHLYRVARLFPDPERYAAFCATYASMRWIDDRVDGGEATPADLDAYAQDIERAFSGGAGDRTYGLALADTFSRFQFTAEPWQRLIRSMRHDAAGGGFATYDDFVDYAEGATVAPAAVFATLLLMRPGPDGYRTAIPYADIRDAVRAAAVACYETHILRDARIDLEAGLNYFPRRELAAYRLEPKGPLDDRWRPYLRAYAMRVRGGWEPAVERMAEIEGPMSDRERLMLHVLVDFYGFSLQKIFRLNFDVWSDRHWPTGAEIATLTEALTARYEPQANLAELVTGDTEDV